MLSLYKYRKASYIIDICVNVWRIGSQLPKLRHWKKMTSKQRIDNKLFERSFVCQHTLYKCNIAIFFEML